MIEKIVVTNKNKINGEVFELSITHLVLQKNRRLTDFLIIVAGAVVANTNLEINTATLKDVTDVEFFEWIKDTVEMIMSIK